VFLTLTLTLFAFGTSTKILVAAPAHLQPQQQRDAPHMNVPDMTMGQRAFISGKVVLDDGTQLTESATILTICRGHRQAVTHTDSHGSSVSSLATGPRRRQPEWPLRMRTRRGALPARCARIPAGLARL